MAKTKKMHKVKPVNNFLLLIVLTVFQLITGIVSASSGDEFQGRVFFALGVLVVVEWLYLVFFYTAFHRRNFELEIIAFFLSGVGLVTIGSINPEAAFKQLFMVLAGIVVFIFMVFLMGNVSDSVRVSLLTCAPGSEIYSLFGHTALRYENPAKGEDWVFNYGLFSFDTPNFVYRFVKGETDYQLGVIPYRYFEGEYAMRGSSVYQQELNLTDKEKENVIRLLRENYLPANRVYRYNYFYDNCTTRARDKVAMSHT